jgi:hypothetical protein
MIYSKSQHDLSPSWSVAKSVHSDPSTEGAWTKMLTDAIEHPGPV